MGPDFGLGIGRDTADNDPPRPRPTLFVRGMEIAGLALVAYGLSDFSIVLIVAGDALILGSYALYRRRHGRPGSGATGGSAFDSGEDGAD
jgi:hypothetical protein